MNSNRLWAVVNFTSNEILYSSFDYNRAKASYDKLVKPLTDETGMFYPNIGDLWDICFIRYDINRSYVEDNPHISVFQKSLNDDFRAFMDMCLLKRGSNTNTNTNEVKKC